MSAIDGHVVYFTDDLEWHGTVLGDDCEGWVRVKWDCPEPFVGVHRIDDLTTYDIPDELAELIRRQGRQLYELRSFLLRMPVDLKTQLLIHGKLEETLLIAKGLA